MNTTDLLIVFLPNVLCKFEQSVELYSPWSFAFHNIIPRMIVFYDKLSECIDVGNKSSWLTITELRISFKYTIPTISEPALELLNIRRSNIDIKVDKKAKTRKRDYHSLLFSTLHSPRSTFWRRCQCFLRSRTIA